VKELLVMLPKIIFMGIMSVTVIPYTISGDAQSATYSPGDQSNLPPKTWIDSDTGHRIIRLTDDPGSIGLYFNVQAYTPDGLDMIYKSRAGIGIVNLATNKTRLIVKGPVRDIVVGTRTRRVFFMKSESSTLYAANLDTGEIRKLVDLPPRANIETINADETLAAGTYIEGNEDDFSDLKVDSSVRETAIRATKTDMRFNAHIPIVLFTVDLRSGKTNHLLHSTDWLNHTLFSPTDPTLLMYCHEGDWDKVDRIWTINTNGSGNRLIHTKSMVGEIAGHEFGGGRWQNNLV